MAFNRFPRSAQADERRQRYGLQDPPKRFRPPRQAPRLPSVHLPHISPPTLRRPSLPDWGIGRHLPDSWPILLAALFGAVSLAVVVLLSDLFSSGDPPGSGPIGVIVSPDATATTAPQATAQPAPSPETATRGEQTDGESGTPGESEETPAPDTAAVATGGRSFAYINPDGSLVVANEDGEQSTVADAALHPAVAPDGAIAFVEYDGAASTITLFDGEDTEQIVGPAEGMIRNLVWEDESDAVLYHEQPDGHSSTRVRRHDLETGKVSTILESSQLDIPDASVQGFDITTDGRLVVQLSIAPDENQYANGCGIYVIHPGTRETTALFPISPGACLGLPSVSPDGTRVAFIAYPGDGSGYVAVAGAAGRDYRQLAAVNLRGTADFPFWPRIAWSPDSETVLYETVEDRELIYAQDADGAGERTLVGYGRHPAWR